MRQGLQNLDTALAAFAFGPVVFLPDSLLDALFGALFSASVDSSAACVSAAAVGSIR